MTTVIGDGSSVGYGNASQTTQYAQQTMMMNLALSANPWLANAPDALMRIGTSGASPLEVAENSAALAGIEAADQMAASIRNLTPVAQRSVWSKLTEQQQRALQQVGFTPVEEDKGGFLDNTPLAPAWDIAADVAGVVTKPISTVATPTLKGAMDILTWVGDTPAHFYRSIRQMEGWQQWLALAGGVGAMALLGPGAAAFLAGSLGTGVLGTTAAAGAIGGVGLAGAVAATAPSAVTNTTEWWDLVNPFDSSGIGGGERVFKPNAQRDAKAMLGQAEHLDALARDIAVEIDVYDLAEEFAGVRNASNQQVLTRSIERVASRLADPGTPEYEAVFKGLDTLIQQPEFREAIDLLQSNKVSVGRDVANAVGLEEGDFGYGAVSGAVDAFWVWSMDPMILMGKAGNVTRLARRGFKSEGRMFDQFAQMVNDDKAVGQIVDDIADAVNRGDFAAMPVPWRGHFNAMQEFVAAEATRGHTIETFDRAEFLRYMNGGEGVKLLLQGKGTVRGMAQLVVDPRNHSQGWGKFVNWMRHFEKGVADEVAEAETRAAARKFGVEAEYDLYEPAVYAVSDGTTLADEVPEMAEAARKAHAAGRTVGGLVQLPGLRWSSNLVGSLSTMIPANKAIKLVPDSADDIASMAEDIPRFVEAMGRHMNMPSQYRDKWLNHIMTQGTVGQRRAAMESFMESLLTVTGFRSDAALSQVADEFILKYRQAYALGGRDVMEVGEDALRIMGALPDAHQAVYFIMPDIRLMQKLVREGHTVKTIARITDADWSEMVMSRVIKPGWLMRIGFIPRAAGEENLAFLARMTEGGIVQEFAGRRLARQKEWRGARLALQEAGGDLRKLTDVQREALSWRIPTHLKPLAAVGRRVGWSNPDSSLLYRYIDWGNARRADGFGIDMPDVPLWADALMFGKAHSYRRMVLSGVDPDLVEAGSRWSQRHAATITRATSAQNSSLFERDVVSPNIQKQLVEVEGKPGHYKEVDVRMNGDRIRVDQNSQYFAGAVHHRATEWSSDNVIRDIFADITSDFLPPELAGQLDPNDLAEVAISIQRVLAKEGEDLPSRYLTKKLFLELVDGNRRDTTQAVANDLAEYFPEASKIVSHANRRGRFNLDDLDGEFREQAEFLKSQADGMRSQLDSLIPDPAAEAEMAELYGQANQLLRAADDLRSLKPTVEWINALDGDAAHWARVFASRHMAGEGHDAQRLLRAARGADAEPSFKLHRGIRDDSTFRINPDGSATFFPTEQAHSKLHTISTSTEPRQAATYATAEARNDMIEGLDSGAIVEMDGDWVLEQVGMTREDLYGKPVSYFGDDQAVEGAVLRGAPGADQFTEVAITRATPLTIPAGRWRIRGSEETRALWSEEWMDAPDEWSQYLDRVYDAIGDVPMEEAMPRLDTAIDNFIDSLTAEEHAYLIQLYDKQTESVKAYNAKVWDEPDYPTPSAVLGAALMGDDDYVKFAEDVGDPIRASIFTKLNDVLAREASPNASMDIREFTRELSSFFDDGHATLFEDAVRERLGVEELIQDLSLMDSDHAFRVKGRSSYNTLMRGGWGLRGQGGWSAPTEAADWSPFITDWSTYRDRLVTEVTAALHRPEHTHLVKRSEQLLSYSGESDIARAPADGLSRLYTPVVDAETTKIDTLLDTPVSDTTGITATMTSTLHRLRNLDEVPQDRRMLAVQDALAEILLMRNSNPDHPAVNVLAGTVESMLDGRLIRDLNWTDDVQTTVNKLIARIEDLDLGDYRTRARQLLNTWEAHRYTDPIIDALSEDEQIALLARVLAHYDESRSLYSLKTTQPLHDMGFDDPRVATWISTLLADGAPRSRVGVLEVDRKALTQHGGGKHGMWFKQTHGDAGREWQLGPMYRSSPRPMEAPQFHRVEYDYVDPDSGIRFSGTDVVPGTSLEVAYQKWAERIVDNVLASTRRGVREQQVFKGQRQDTKRIVRRMGNGHEELMDGEAMLHSEPLYALSPGEKLDNAEVVHWGDNRFFDHVELEAQEDLMWGILGPAIRDVHEQRAGLSTVAQKPVRLDGDTPIWKSETDIGEAVSMTRSRIDDVASEPSAALPNVAITRIPQPNTDKVWDRIVQFGFNRVIGPSLDGLSRHPMSFHYYARAFKEYKRNLNWLLDRELIDVRFADEFADTITQLSRASDQADESADLIRLIARDVFDQDVPVEHARRWMRAQADTPEGWTQMLDEARAVKHREASMSAARMAQTDRPADQLAAINAFYDEQPAAAVVRAIDEVANLDWRAGTLRLSTEGAGSNSMAEALVAEFDRRIPDEIWDQGVTGLKKFLRQPGNEMLPIPKTDDQWAALIDARSNYHYAITTMDEAAAMRAMNNVIPFLDSHEQRSLFGEYARNFIPFWYAEENFLKRWARTMALSQAAIPGISKTIPLGGLDRIRQMQLTYMGFKTAGSIRTDANGEDWIIYPGSPVLNEAIQKILPGQVQVPVAFGANTMSLLPGLTDENHIAPSPFAVLPVHVIAAIFPEAEETKNAILGPIGSQRSIASQFVPSAFTNIWNIYKGSDSTQYASAMIAAMAYAEARGEGLPEGATGADVQDYIDKMENHARIIMVSKALVGFVGPGAPRPIVTDDNFDALVGLNVEDPKEVISEQYRTYIMGMGIEEGTSAFLAANPDADLEDLVNPIALTVSGTESLSRAQLPSTRVGISWYENNKAWVDQMPEAGAWFVPVDADGAFDIKAYQKSLTNGLRKRRTPEEFVRAMRYRTSADEYFRNREEYEARVLQVGNDQERKRALDGVWDRWSTRFKAANPLFAEELVTGTARTRRSRTIEQMRYAVDDPSAAQSPYLTGIRELVKAFDQLNARMEQLRLKSDATSRQQLRDLKALFGTWGETWALDNPDIARLWTSVYRVEAGL